MKPQIPRLVSGGLITNYFCTSQCRHCAYFSSPSWPKEYISPETAQSLLGTVKRKDCRSLHIGGGEPLLRPELLFPVLEQFGEAGVGIDYIETNSSWYKNTETGEEDAKALLSELKDYGVSTLLISISPFHNEYIPFAKVEGVLRACRTTGMGIFPWVDGFIPDLKTFDPDTRHPMEEYEKTFGPDYLQRIPNRYWISFRGRALTTYKQFMDPKTPETIMGENPRGCRELFDVGHFHVDLFGNYIPGLCTGLSIDAEDLEAPLSEGKYPFITILMKEGIEGLLHKAVEDFDFIPAAEYGSKCDLCYGIRHYLVTEKGIETPDLQPEGYYRHD